ncbi:MAG: response regulator [Phycisphaerae bacterium]|nr:response regulator [Phycisphaerae bacterium]
MARVLIVEDEPHIARVMALWLSRHGHTVLETTNGKKALEVLAGESVDIIVTDMNMPEMDGVTLVEKARSDLGLKTPILLLTARCDHAAVQAQLDPFGVRLYTKPFVPSRLVADIEEQIGALSA